MPNIALARNVLAPVKELLVGEELLQQGQAAMETIAADALDDEITIT